MHLLCIGALAACSVPVPVPDHREDLEQHHRFIEEHGSVPVPTRTLLRQAAQYRSWPRFEAHRARAIKSPGHDELWLVAHYNEAAAGAVTGRLTEFPEGSIIVGENRANPVGPPVALTTMVKESDGWRWIGHEPGGRVLMTGDLDGCRRCHDAAGRDMVFGGTLPSTGEAP
jgi:hypothetical protein